EGPAVVLWRPGQPWRPVTGDLATGAFPARQRDRGAWQPRSVAAGDRRAPRRGTAQGQFRPAAGGSRRGPRHAAAVVAPAEAGTCRPWAGLDDGARRPRAEVDHAARRKARPRDRGAPPRRPVPAAAQEHVRRRAGVEPAAGGNRPPPRDYQHLHATAVLLAAWAHLLRGQ